MAGPVSSSSTIRPAGIVPLVVVAGLGVWLALVEQTGWAIICFWFVTLIVTGMIRGVRRRQLETEASLGGGAIVEPVSPFFWLAILLGIAWRTVLFLTPAAVAWYFADGDVFMVAVGVVLGLVGLFFAATSLRLSLRNARRRADGLPPEVPTVPFRPGS